MGGQLHMNNIQPEWTHQQYATQASLDKIKIEWFYSVCIQVYLDEPYEPAD